MSESLDVLARADLFLSRQRGSDAELNVIPILTQVFDPATSSVSPQVTQVARSPAALEGAAVDRALRERLLRDLEKIVDRTMHERVGRHIEELLEQVRAGLVAELKHAVHGAIREALEEAVDAQLEHLRTSATDR
jgi:acyl-CoA reductase-like NAD-dependent aldehyde dehydrogenase